MIRWAQQLEAVIRRSGPFAWGRADCCQFAARCVAAMTGNDFAVAYRYGTAREAARVLRASGGVEAIATRHLGPARPGKRAIAGDVVMVAAPWPTLGVCVGSRVALQGSAGIEYVPLGNAVLSWGV